MVHKKCRKGLRGARMKSRKELKKNAKTVMKKHYWLYVALCLIAGILGTEYTSSVEFGKTKTESYVGTESGVDKLSTNSLTDEFLSFVWDIGHGQEDVRREAAEAEEHRYVEESEQKKNAVLGRSRGAFSEIINKTLSGAYLVSLAVAIRSIVGSDGVTTVILTLLGLAVIFFVQTFVVGIYRVVMRRMFLEGRCYQKVPVTRVWFLLKIKKWIHAGVTLLVSATLELLWCFTLVGGVIKYFSYYMVPFIVAENPGIRTMDAITLSRRMMNGHKWECFKLEMSFCGWKILGTLTLGLLEIFFVNPYQTATIAEYYAELRGLVKEKQIPLSDQLNDQYLFEAPTREMLDTVYSDVKAVDDELTGPILHLKGVRKFLADWFGLAVGSQKELDTLEQEENRRFRVAHMQGAYRGEVYPVRLYPIPEKKKRKGIENMNFLRHYSAGSIIMIFFVMSFVGWLWEVSLHLITDGVFVNRGVMHGPWLPIYGAGSVLILMLLNKLRVHPVAEFAATVVVCGTVEYFTSYFLEVMHHGEKWWDYTGYFLNLNGRICAEGLLTFGVGGMAIVYVLAPFLDSIIRKIPIRRLMTVCVLLICIFAADQVYSSYHPNMGAGITDYESHAYGWQMSVRLLML